VRTTPKGLEPSPPEAARAPWRHRLHTIIFEADTPAGRTFDIVLIIAITTSIVLVVFETVTPRQSPLGRAMFIAEWILTGLFTIEYAARLIAVRRPAAYAKSFFGIVDLVAILPAYVSLVFAGGQYFLVLRALRLLRVFRIFKLAHFLSGAQVLTVALRAARYKIAVFLFTVVTIVLIVGALMYVIEGRTNGFTSIPASMYWAIVTLTTVGYGDVAPVTTLGRFVASMVMILGYGIIAVPTGIVTSELVQAARRPEEISGQACPSCSAEGHPVGAEYCFRCGDSL
jgi:voltage-gated potassium channel